MSNDERKPLSLLNRTATGGDVAQEGFSYQEAVMLARIPFWLEKSGFEACNREGIDDIEAKFFVPKYGRVKERIQVKRERITAARFKSLVLGFWEGFQSSPKSYQWVTLALRELASDIEPLVSGLRRLRGAYKFYRDDEVISENSYRDYEVRAQDFGFTNEQIRFIYTRLLINTEIPDAVHTKGVFSEALNKTFPEYGQLPASTYQSIYEQIKLLVQEHKIEEISRRMIDNAIRKAIAPYPQPVVRPVSLFTSIAAETEEPPTPPIAIPFDWESFFGGQQKNFPPPSEWTRVVSELEATRDWIHEYHCATTCPRIELHGNRRLSTAFAIGYVFNAVSGFAIDLQHRSVFSTDDYPDATTPDYPITVKLENHPSTDIIVSISIPPLQIEDAVANFRLLNDGSSTAWLHIQGQDAITSPKHANRAVSALKEAIRHELTRTPRERIHLFFGGPSFLALMLGHRCNAMPKIQCYEFTNTTYVQTCTLPAR